MRNFNWHSEPGLAPHWYKIYGWLPNRYLPIVEFDSIPIYKPNMKGGHRHNHVRNARFRGNVCPYCDGIIAKGCGERRYDGVLFCTECAQADYEERCDRVEYLSHIYG